MPTYHAHYDKNGELILQQHDTTEGFADENNFKRGLGSRKQMLTDIVRFAGTFTAVFLFLFVSLNFQSFSQMLQARIFPNANREERMALRVMTDPVLKERLLSVPELPTAGRQRISLVSVAPPDNRLIVPKIGKNIPLVPVTDDALIREDWKTFENDIQHALRFGVVHYPGTAEPGQLGNVFITGHSSYYPLIDPGKYKDVFALLQTLEVGDEYSIYYNEELHSYRIAEKFEISPKDVSVLLQPAGRRMSTLMTCTPVGTTLRRLILQADEISPVTGEVLEVVAGEIAPAPAPAGKWGGELAV